MTVAGLNLLFPAVLAIHTVEECLRFKSFSLTLPAALPPRLRERSAFVGGAVLLTLSAGTLEIYTFAFRSVPGLLLCRLALFALLANGIGHCARSMLRGRVLPGTWSAAFLVVPYCTLTSLAMRPSGQTGASFVLEAMLGVLIMPLAAGVFLLLGAGLLWLLRLRQVSS